MTHYAEPAPDPPRDHAEFEVFIRDLDAGRAPPVRTEDCRVEKTVGDVIADFIQKTFNPYRPEKHYMRG